MLKKLYDRCVELARHKFSKPLLGFVAFIESFFFPVPPDLLIVPMVVAKREDYLKMTNIKDVNYLLSKKPWEIVSKLEDNSYFIVLTHSHDYDLKILNEILKKNNTFVGLIGSLTKKKRFHKRLIDKGHNKSIVEKIEFPIGIEIGNSKDPNEIAFSIITRIISIKNSLKHLSNNKIKKVI